MRTRAIWTQAGWHRRPVRLEWRGGTGAGIGICDVEQDYNPDHADLPVVSLRGATVSFPGQDENHGTAVLGILAARNDGIRATGIAHHATVYFAYGLDNANCINVNHTADGVNSDGGTVPGAGRYIATVTASNGFGSASAQTEVVVVGRLYLPSILRGE